MTLSNSNPQQKRILLQVSGSIAAFKAVALCSKLVQANYDVEVVMTEGAEHFVGAASFEGLTRKPVHRGLYDEGHMMAHIDLERWADHILLYPASANTIASLATGRSDTLIGSIFLAHEFKKPYWVVPAMNQAMIAHPATRTHIQTLKCWGIEVLNSDEGSLACGEIGQGRLVEPEALLQKLSDTHPLLQSATRSDHFLPRVLITSGGTVEPIDEVRSITNFSSGETGYTLATALAAQGFEVTFIQSRLSHFQLKHERNASAVSYLTTDEFTDAVKTELKTHHYDVILHAAAVADYHVEKTPGKIQTDQPFQLKLLPNEKVLKSVRKWSKNPDLKVISFKLTAGEGEHASAMKLDSYDSEFVIHNEKKNVNGAIHSGTIFKKNPAPKSSADRYSTLETFQTKTELTKLVSNLVSGLAPIKAIKDTL